MNYIQYHDWIFLIYIIFNPSTYKKIPPTAPTVSGIKVMSYANSSINFK